MGTSDRAAADAASARSAEKDDYRRRWENERKERISAHHAGRHPAYWLWRGRLFLTLARSPYRWKLRYAWQYAGILCGSAIYDHRKGDWESFPTPAEALEVDRQYWED